MSISNAQPSVAKKRGYRLGARAAKQEETRRRIVDAAIGALTTRFRAKGMALTMAAAALLQLAIGIFGLVAGRHDFPEIGAYQVMGVTGLFVTLWLFAAGLFWLAARRPAEA